MTTQSHRIDVPAFFCPLPSAIHQRVHEVEERSITWLKSNGLIVDERTRRQLTGTNSADFYARFAPHATVMDGLQAATDWVYWGFAFDDLYCDRAETRQQPDRFVVLVARLLRMLDGMNPRLCGDNALLHALFDIADRFTRCSTPVQMQRWVLSLRTWLFGVVQRNSLRAIYGVPGIDHFTTMRLHDCGGTPCAAPMEIADGAEIPGRELDSAPVRALTEAFLLLAAWDNDRISQYKEQAESQGSDYSVVDAFQHEKRCSRQRALTDSIAVRDRVMCLFLHLSDQVRRGASTPLRSYVDDLSYALRGNIEWSLNVPRYASVPGSAEDDRAPVRIGYATGFHDTPTDSGGAPPETPSIAWWWDQLR